MLGLSSCDTYLFTPQADVSTRRDNLGWMKKWEIGARNAGLFFGVVAFFVCLFPVVVVLLFVVFVVVVCFCFFAFSDWVS